MFLPDSIVHLSVYNCRDRSSLTTIGRPFVFLGRLHTFKFYRRISSFIPSVNLPDPRSFMKGRVYLFSIYSLGTFMCTSVDVCDRSPTSHHTGRMTLGVWGGSSDSRSDRSDDKDVGRRNNV